MYNYVQPLQPLYNYYNMQYNCVQPLQSLYNYYNIQYNHYNNYTIMYNKCIQFIYVFHALYMYLQFIFRESYMKKQPVNK